MVLAKQNKQNTVQNLPDATKDSSNALDLFIYPHTRTGILSRYGTRQRERELRFLYRHEQNWMATSAFAGVMKHVATTPWEIKGPPTLSAKSYQFYRLGLKQFGRSEPTSTRPDIEYWQELLRQADFGRGWGSFIKKGVDYLRQDAGWFWEIIAPGSSIKAPTGPATGIAHLDSLRCIPTGDPEFPVIYIDSDKEKHRMHHTRVVQLIDMPDGDEDHPGYGLCALSRASSIVWRQILITRYIEQHVDDKPPPGMVVASNMLVAERNRALARYQDEQLTDERIVWGKQVWFFGADADKPIKIDMQSFSTAPEKFDFKVYTEIDVDAIALALGVDRQELWQLTGGNIGSATQSQVLHAKARGKTFGDLLTSIERVINDILPEEYEFKFKFRDEEEDNQQAQVASTWAATVAAIGPHITDEEARRILANQIEGVHDAITDESGELLRRDDADVQDDDDIGKDEATVDDKAPEIDAEDEAQVTQRAVRQLDAATLRDTSKQFQATLLDFEAEFADAIQALIDEDIDRRRFGIVARALLRRHGQNAMLDGLKEGGVDTEALEADELATFTVWLAEQSLFVTNLGGELKSADHAVNAESRAQMWSLKSLQEVWNLGRLAAAANAMYEFTGALDDASCKDCIQLVGQRHRFKAFVRTRYMPGLIDSRLECGAFNCKHRLVRTQEKARGRFPRAA